MVCCPAKSQWDVIPGWSESPWEPHLSLCVVTLLYSDNFLLLQDSGLTFPRDSHLSLFSQDKGQSTSRSSSTCPARWTLRRRNGASPRRPWSWAPRTSGRTGSSSSATSNSRTSTVSLWVPLSLGEHFYLLLLGCFSVRAEVKCSRDGSVSFFPRPFEYKLSQLWNDT